MAEERDATRTPQSRRRRSSNRSDPCRTPSSWVRCKADAASVYAASVRTGRARNFDTQVNPRQPPRDGSDGDNRHRRTLARRPAHSPSACILKRTGEGPGEGRRRRPKHGKRRGACARRCGAARRASRRRARHARTSSRRDRCAEGCAGSARHSLRRSCTDAERGGEGVVRRERRESGAKRAGGKDAAARARRDAYLRPLSQPPRLGNEYYTHCMPHTVARELPARCRLCGLHNATPLHNAALHNAATLLEKKKECSAALPRSQAYW